MNVSQKEHFWTVLVLVGVIISLTSLLLLTRLDYIRTSIGLTEKDTTSVVSEKAESPFLKKEEVVIVHSTSTTAEEITLPVEEVLFEYVQVKDSCGVHFQGECVRARSGPGLEFPVVAKLRNNVVLRIDGKVEYDGYTWYKIIFDEFLRYPNRINSDWYVVADYVEVLHDEGSKTLWEDGSASTTKKIIVDIAEQKLYAYDGAKLFMETSISTGLELSPTPRGSFTIFKKTPSRYMQGPLPGHTDIYDLPGVPWNLYFTHEGAVIHGAYWHDSFGSRYSHGCVNLAPDEARELYNWAELGVQVTIR